MTFGVATIGARGEGRFMIGRRCGWLVLLVAATMQFVWMAETAGAGAGDQEGGAFLPPDYTLVLLAGMPGDLESEKRYRDQVESWLELADSRESKPKNVYVLSDPLDGLDARSRLPLQVAKSSREAFLALGDQLAGQNNPLVVIALGHGGTLAGGAVLHVEGPRVTPQDFKAFAAAQPGRKISRWVLCFRGSGEFAKQLAAPGRSILTSEKNVSLAHDPIGLPLLEQGLRAKPGVGLIEAAEDWGRATAGWYEERGLARTEQPTLWIEELSPRSLANPGRAAATIRPAAAAKKPPARPAEAEPARRPLPELASQLPARWDAIERVDPLDYAGADAVVLWQKVSYTVSRAPSLSSEHEAFVQILTPQGKHYGDFDFSFSPPQEELKIIDCEVLQPDGSLLRLPAGGIRDEGEPAGGGYNTARRKFFSLPGVTPGAILHVRYQRAWKSYPLPHVSLTVPVGDSLPIVAAAVEVSVPKESVLHFKLNRVEARDPELKQTANGTRYEWQFRDVPALVDDALAAPDNRGALSLSTFPDWPAFAGWYGRIIREADKMSPEIEAQVAALTRDAETDRDKLVALYNYVTGLRYVAVPLGVNSVRPHAAANVFRNQFGDCKDKANLLNTMLRSIGIEAHLVLVPRFTQAYEAVPGFAFNHAISRVVLGDEVWWLDTSDDVCRFGMLPPGDLGRQVLVIDGESTSLTQLPAARAGEHALALRGQLDCRDPSAPLPASLAVTSSGIADYVLRSNARHITPRQSTRPLLTSICRPSSGSFALGSQSFTAAADLGAAFAWGGDGSGVGLVTRSGDDYRVRVPFWIPRAWDIVLHSRQAPLFIHQGYPLKLEQKIDVALPGAANNLILPAASSGVSDSFCWQLEWSSQAGGRVEAKLGAELLRGDLRPGDTPVLQAELQRLFEALAGEIRFSLTPE